MPNNQQDRGLHHDLNRFNHDDMLVNNDMLDYLIKLATLLVLVGLASALFGVTSITWKPPVAVRSSQ